jgi:predicted nuclease with TOPRIM domain
MTIFDQDDDQNVDTDVVTDEDGGSSADSSDDFSQQAGGAATMLNLEELIKNHIDSIDKLKEELKTTREMFEDSFNNNPTYKEHVDKVKDVQRAKSSVRQQIAKQPSVATLEQKVKDVRFDISEKGKTLSDLLQDYKEQTGATSIETRNGQVLEIVSTSKLVRSKGAK